MEFRVRYSLVELNRFRNVFGVRIALFVVESDDPDYYEKPFSPGGIAPGSYSGISQVDRCRAVPQLHCRVQGRPVCRTFLMSPIFGSSAGRSIIAAIRWSFVGRSLQVS
ncbi:minor head protein [Pseudomonas phage WP1]